MCKIARIITTVKSLNTLDFIDVTSDVTKIDDTMPTIVVGKKFAEEIFGKENIHVLDKTVRNKISWTFSKTERRNDFERDVMSFNKQVFNNIFKTVKYEYINIFTCGYSKIKEILDILNSSENKITYLYKNHIYLYFNGKIYGISVSDTKYIGIDNEKVGKIFKESKNNKILRNTYFMSKNLEKMIEDKRFIVPYIYFLHTN